MVLITAQQGVARPDWGRREVRTITPGPHLHQGKLGWGHVLPMGAEPKRRPNFEYASTVLFEGLTFRTWSSLVAFGGIGACHSLIMLIVKALETGYRITLFSHTFSSDSSIVSSSPKRLYTTIENPSYFFMTLSCTEAIQSFSSHFNQYSLVDPSWGNIPSWVWRGVSHWFRNFRRRVWHHRHFGNWISWK